jgi:hypothetical protein
MKSLLLVIKIPPKDVVKKRLIGYKLRATGLIAIGSRTAAIGCGLVVSRTAKPSAAARARPKVLGATSTGPRPRRKASLQTKPCRPNQPKPAQTSPNTILKATFSGSKPLQYEFSFD